MTGFPELINREIDPISMSFKCILPVPQGPSCDNNNTASFTSEKTTDP